MKNKQFYFAQLEFHCPHCGGSFRGTIHEMPQYRNGHREVSTKCPHCNAVVTKIFESEMV